MSKLDLDALAAEVAAVLDLDADVLSAKRTVYEGEYRINLYRKRLHIFRGGFSPHYTWEIMVLVGVDQFGRVIEDGYRVEYKGVASPEALALLSTIWAHVNGQGGEAERIAVPRAEHEALMATMRRHADEKGLPCWIGIAFAKYEDALGGKS